MRVLVLGGGVFLGWHLAAQATARRLQVTTFRRGRAPATMPDGVETIFGDRTTDLVRLGRRTWDVVYDCCGYDPVVVDESCRVLKERVGRYVYVSSVLAYRDLSRSVEESSPTYSSESDTPRESDPTAYGPRKGACERAVRERMGTRASIVRPGYMVGPRDRSARMARWANRSLRAGRVLIPSAGAAPWQFIDVRDATAFMLGDAVTCSDRAWNVTGPASVQLGTALLERVLASAGQCCPIEQVPLDHLRRVGASFTLDQVDWAALPLDEAGTYAMSVENALDAGLRVRPVESTMSDIREDIACRPSGPGSARDAMMMEQHEAAVRFNLSDAENACGQSDTNKGDSR